MIHTKTLFTLYGTLRKIDTAPRIGGDEFVILLPNTDEKGAVTVIERVKEQLLETMTANNWPVTFSIGLPIFKTPPNSPNDMLKYADDLMYKVKSSGKNNIMTSTI